MYYLTTTKIAAKFGIDRKELFLIFSEWGWLRRVDNKWVLTDLGKAQGGQVRSTVGTGNFPVWPENLKISLPSNTLVSGEETVRVASEGEDYIAEYLYAVGVSFETEWEVEGLKADSASYRHADFYLTMYRVCIEFAGLWNASEAQRTRYRTKKKVYEQNGIPCIWLYPDNLGILHYIFHRRLEDVLKKHRLNRELVTYRIGQLWTKDSDNLFGFVAGITGLVYLFPWNQDVGWPLFWGGVVIYNVYKLGVDITKIKRGQSLEISRLTKWESD